MSPRADTPPIAQLESAALEVAASVLGEGAKAHGVEVAPAGSWGERASRVVPLGHIGEVRLRHDGRGAPFALDNGELLVSLSDENGVAAFAWAAPSAGSRLVGIGVDLVGIDYFKGEVGRKRAKLLLTEHDISVLKMLRSHPAEQEFAFAFAAKEAAFKACAAPLRAWRARNGKKLEFDVRQFELDGTDCVRVRPDAEPAHGILETLEIRQIRLGHAVVGRLAITIAASLG